MASAWQLERTCFWYDTNSGDDNHKLRAHRTLRGGGGLPNEDEFNALNDKVSTLEKQVESLKGTKVSVRHIKDHLEKRVSKLETSVAEHEQIWGMLHKLKRSLAH